MDDTISRQAAIDALDGEIEVTGKANAKAVLKYTQMVSDRIKALPSVQPEKSEAEDVTFWKKHAREYEDIITGLVAKQAKGVKLDSIEITEGGIIFKSQPEPRWIPVSEKPMKNGEYLVTKIDRITHDKIVDIAHYADFIHDNNGFWKADEVTAWMPLPKPYERSEDANDQIE